jgi:Fe-S-cluster containining protein
MLDNLSQTLLALAFVVLLINIPLWLRSSRLYRRRGEFKCTLCGNCCRLRVISLTKDDVKRLEAAGYRDFASEKGELRLRRVTGLCVLLKNDKCTVYEHRPRVCREFPFFRVYGMGYTERASFCPALEELRDGGRHRKVR